jgi:ATP/maltotriose-dependent transcriptional regulator MalT
MGNLGAQAYFDGRWADAVDLYERSRSAFLRAGNTVQAAITGANVGEVLVSQHRLDEAEPVLRDAARVLRASDFVDGATFAEIQLARLLIARGEVDEAMRLLDTAGDELAALRMYGSALEAVVYLADCRRRRGDAAAALQLLGDAEARAGDEAEMLAAQVARVRSIALLESGFADDALATLAVGIDTAREQGLDYELTLLLTTRAEVLDALGREGDAADLRQIAEISRSLGIRSGAPASSG